MRNILMALGLLALTASPALARHRYATTDTTAEAHTVRLNRYVFSAAGQRTDIPSLCAGGAASQVEVKVTPGDVLWGTLTAGWYTPVHVTVACTPPIR